MRKATLYTRVQLLPCYHSDISPIGSRGGGSGLEWRQSGCRRGPSWWRYRTWSRCRSPRLTKWIWLSYRNISHILTLFETPASRQFALGRLQILVERKTGKSVQRFPKLIAVHIQLDEIENECLCLKLKGTKVSRGDWENKVKMPMPQPTGWGMYCAEYWILSDVYLLRLHIKWKMDKQVHWTWRDHILQCTKNGSA